jgi:hypothetical protein
MMKVVHIGSVGRWNGSAVAAAVGGDVREGRVQESRCLGELGN